MSRFYGAVGYGETVETPLDSGVWVDEIVEHNYYGDVLRNTRQNPEGEHLNDDLTVNNSISIVADAYAIDHFFMIKYTKWQGIRWKVTDVEVRAPRLILRLGGVYNGPTPPGSPTNPS